ncbi:MAG: hypothetical protein ACOH2K_16345 [Burkholderiaceae bacterium]
MLQRNVAQNAPAPAGLHIPGCDFSHAITFVMTQFCFNLNRDTFKSAIVILMQTGRRAQMQAIVVFTQQENSARYVGILRFNPIHNTSQRLGQRSTVRDVR